jgi:hypothetical protein
MVIVQIAPEFPTPVEDIETNDLKPDQNNSQDPYITAYFKADVLPLLFVIGDGKQFNFGNESYYNQPLKQNSSYIVFLRFFETNVSFLKDRKCEVNLTCLSFFLVASCSSAG